MAQDNFATLKFRLLQIVYSHVFYLPSLYINVKVVVLQLYFCGGILLESTNTLWKHN